MSRLSELLKKLEKNVSSASKKSGLRRILSKNRRALTGLALGAATGGVGAGLLGTTGGAGLLATLGGGAVGGATGLVRDKRKRTAEKRSLFKRTQLVNQANARGSLDELIGGIRDPQNPEFNPEFPSDGSNIRLPVQPRITPNQPGTDVLPNAPVELNRPQGGLNLGSSGAGQDEAKILAEAELAKKLQEEAFGAKKAARATSLQDLSALLAKRNDREFNEISPGILEDLNSRGLLRSSALGDRFAKERGRLEARSQEQIGLQSLQDRGTALNESTGILDQFLGSRQGALQRRFSLEDFARQTEASKLLGQATAPIQPFQGGGKGGAGDLAAVAAPVGAIAAPIVGASKAG